MRFLARLAAAALATSSILLGSGAHAVGTRTFTLDSIEKLSGGELKGVSIGSDGVVRAGWLLGNVVLTDASAAFATLPMADGSALVGTGPNGKILRVAGEQSTVYAETGALAVTSLVQAANGAVYAATIPDGKIFRVTQGKAEVFATLQDTSHVWALALDKARTGLFAATGPEGKVWRVEPNGTTSVYYRSEEPHLVSLALADSGDLYAGSSGKALLYRITGPGRATILHDFGGEEVKAVAVAKNGVVWAIANEYGEVPEAPKRSPAAGTRMPVPTTAAARKPGKGTLMRFDATGKPEKMMHHGDFHYMSLALDDGGRPYVGTGAEGRVYTVDDGHTVSLLADADERQIGALGVTGGKPYAVANDPAVFHRVISQGGPDAVWTSKVLDAGLRARFGNLGWKAHGTIELSTRSGNSVVPDLTWTKWSNEMALPGPITTGPARFFQVRARWAKDPKATLSEITIPFVTDNLRPLLLEVSAVQKGVLSRDSKDVLPASGGEVPKHETIVKVSWKVENPDSDPLRYRLAFRKEGLAAWRDVLRDGEAVTKTEYEWETLPLSEGRYRLRVEASDEAANPPDQVLRHALESEVFTIDHTPPTIGPIALVGRRLRVRVTDGLGPIVRVEVAIDGRTDFRPLAPADGVFDTADEVIDGDVSAIVPQGSHLVTIRAFDAAGNVAVREIESN